MNSTIILIGPICAGKSTIAKLLADRLNLSHYEVDDNRWPYFDEIGYDKAGFFLKFRAIGLWRAENTQS